MCNEDIFRLAVIMQKNYKNQATEKGENDLMTAYTRGAADAMQTLINILHLDAEFLAYQSNRKEPLSDSKQ